MKEIERLRREKEASQATRRVYEGLGYSGKPRLKGIGSFGGLGLSDLGEDEHEFRGAYGPFQERYFKADTPEEKEKVLVKEVYRMQQKGWKRKDALEKLALILARAKERMGEMGELL